MTRDRHCSWYNSKRFGSILYITQYTYNNNILTSITYPSGRVITYTPDQVGRISQVSTTLGGQPKTLASAIDYLPFGGITDLTYGNGLFLSQRYDNQYRISSIVVGSILGMTYGYDPNGNITSILDAVSPPGGAVLETPEAYTYQQGTNKLIHIEGTPITDFGYDANGNITSENNWTYVYDLSNQLVRVLSGGNQVAEYVYNGAGQRIKKMTQTETRIFHYDLSGHLIAETNQNGQMISEYIYLGDQPLTMIKPGELAYYFHNDHLGTPQVLTNDAQAIAWKAVYTPFGEAVISIETVENPFRFPGQYYDRETGLHYNYFRYYDPRTGRYVTPDPIGLDGGINLFAYVANNPVKWVDPLGLHWMIDPRTNQPIFHRHGKDKTHWSGKCNNRGATPETPPVASEVFSEMAEDFMSLYGEALVLILGGVVTVETGNPKLGISIYEILSNLFKTVLGKPASLPKIPVKIINPPEAE